MLWKVIAAAYVVMSVVALAVYALDKRRAARGEWRVRERTLHLIALAGGWPGALLAIKLFRHKTRKASFLVVTWLIVLLHAVAWWQVLRMR